jgi:uncharacterized RmlC-like cupin family protein
MDWKTHGVKIVRPGAFDTNTPQTPGMTRTAAITHARVGASKLWAGSMVVKPDAKTGPHHHGELETVLYVVRGYVRMRWGDHLELSDEAGPGDFIYVPPYVPHQRSTRARTRAVKPSSFATGRSRSWSISISRPPSQPVRAAWIFRFIRRSTVREQPTRIGEL